MEQKKLTREEIAMRDLGKTNISRQNALALVTIFIITLLAYMFAQLICNKNCWQPIADYKSEKQKTASKFSFLNENEIIKKLFRKWEKQTEDYSVFRKAILPHLQKIITYIFKNGNEKVICGKDKWLFYSEDYKYLASKGFLDKTLLKNKKLNGIQPDPVKCINNFNEQLKKRGIKLIIMPVPAKNTIYADKLGASEYPLYNKDFHIFLKQINAESIHLHQLFADMRKNGTEPYLKTDTHWTPAGMELAAQKITAALYGTESFKQLPAAENISSEGDTARMLGLKNSTQLFPKENVKIHPVPFAPDINSEVILLGDSFTNIYSLSSMEWGTSAGLAEILAHYTGKTIDVIARNDSGAYSSREILLRELIRGRDRLKGKKYVIWEFAERELISGNWKIMDFSVNLQSKNADFISVAKPITVTATIIEFSVPPHPGAAPYKDHVMTLRIGDINGTDSEALVYAESMRNNILQPAAKLRSGDTVKIKLSPWSNGAEKQYDAWNRSELADESLLLNDFCWGEIIQTQGIEK